MSNSALQGIAFTTEPNSTRVLAPKSLIFGWSRCDCCAVCIGLGNNIQSNVVFLPRGLRGKLQNFCHCLKSDGVWRFGLCLVLESSFQPALLFFRLVAEIWCSGRD